MLRIDTTLQGCCVRLKRYMQVCEHIVIPNIRLRDDMEEMFEMNWVEYVRRDTEGSDNDTRRRAATDLVKALTARFEAPVSSRPDACSAEEPQTYLHTQTTGS